MKTAISIPDRLFESAERAARRLGVSRSELYSRAVEEYIAHRQTQWVTDRLDEIYGPDEESSGLDAQLEALQARTLGTRDR